MLVVKLTGEEYTECSQNDCLLVREVEFLDAGRECEDGLHVLLAVYGTHCFHVHCVSPEQCHDPVLVVEALVVQDRPHVFARNYVAQNESKVTRSDHFFTCQCCDVIFGNVLTFECCDVQQVMLLG